MAAFPPPRRLETGATHATGPLGFSIDRSVGRRSINAGGRARARLSGRRRAFAPPAVPRHSATAGNDFKAIAAKLALGWRVKIDAMNLDYQSPSIAQTLPPVSKPVPIWLAGAVMGLTLCLGAILVWKYRMAPASPPNVARVVVPPLNNPRVAGGGGAADAADPKLRLVALAAAAEADLPDGAHEAADGSSVLFKSGDAYMRLVRGAKAGDPPRYAFGTFSLPDVEWEHGYLSQGVRRILEQADYAKQLGVTKAQWDKLDALPAAPAAKWPQDDRDRFAALALKWDTTAGDAKAAAATEVVKAIGAFATKKREADQKAMAERIKAVREILTADQVKQINPIPRWDVKAGAATTAPARK
jgi:hypothetical protein